MFYHYLELRRRLQDGVELSDTEGLPERLHDTDEVLDQEEGVHMVVQQVQGGELEAPG